MALTLTLHLDREELGRQFLSAKRGAGGPLLERHGASWCITEVSTVTVTGTTLAQASSNKLIHDARARSDQTACSGFDARAFGELAGRRGAGSGKLGPAASGTQFRQLDLNPFIDLTKSCRVIYYTPVGGLREHHNNLLVQRHPKSLGGCTEVQFGRLPACPQTFGDSNLAHRDMLSVQQN
jgi:hypothetical protein